MENSQAISKLHDIVERTSNDVKMLIKHFHMVQTQIDQLTKVQQDLLVNASREKEKHVYEVTTRGGVSTHDGEDSCNFDVQNLFGDVLMMSFPL